MSSLNNTYLGNVTVSLRLYLIEFPKMVSRSLGLNDGTVSNHLYILSITYTYIRYSSVRVLLHKRSWILSGKINGYRLQKLNPVLPEEIPNKK